jgi:hypothetical protein
MGVSATGTTLTGTPSDGGATASVRLDQLSTDTTQDQLSSPTSANARLNLSSPVLLAQMPGSVNDGLGKVGGYRPPVVRPPGYMQKAPGDQGVRPRGRHLKPGVGDRPSAPWQPTAEGKPNAKGKPSGNRPSSDPTSNPAELKRPNRQRPGSGGSRTPPTSGNSLQHRIIPSNEGLGGADNAAPRGGSGLSRLDLGSAVDTLFESKGIGGQVEQVKNLVSNLINTGGPYTTTSVEMNTSLTWRMSRDGEITITAEDDVGYKKAGETVAVGNVSDLIERTHVRFDSQRDVDTQKAYQAWQRTGKLPNSPGRAPQPSRKSPAVESPKRSASEPSNPNGPVARSGAQSPGTGGANLGAERNVYRVESAELGLNGQAAKNPAGRYMRDALLSAQADPKLRAALSKLKPGAAVKFPNGGSITRLGQSQHGFFLDFKVPFASGRLGRFTAEFDKQRGALDLPKGLDAKVPSNPPTRSSSTKPRPVPKVTPLPQVKPRPIPSVSPLPQVKVPTPSTGAPSATKPPSAAETAPSRTPDEQWEDYKKNYPDLGDMVERAVQHDGISIAEVMKEHEKGGVLSEILAKLRDRGIGFSGGPPNTRPGSAVAGGFEEPDPKTKAAMTTALRGLDLVTDDVTQIARQHNIAPLAWAHTLASVARVGLPAPQVTQSPRSDAQVRRDFSSPAHWGLTKSGLFSPNSKLLSGQPAEMWSELRLKFGHRVAVKLFDANLRSGFSGVLDALNLARSKQTVSIQDALKLSYLVIASKSAVPGAGGVGPATLHDLMHSITGYGLNEFQESQGNWFSDAVYMGMYKLMHGEGALNPKLHLGRQPGSAQVLDDFIRSNFDELRRGAAPLSNYVSSFKGPVAGLEAGKIKDAYKQIQQVEKDLEASAVLSELNRDQRATLKEMLLGTGQRAQPSLLQIVQDHVRTGDTTQFEAAKKKWMNGPAMLLKAAWQAKEMKLPEFYDRASRAVAFRLLLERAAPGMVKKNDSPFAASFDDLRRLNGVDLRKEYPKILKEVRELLRPYAPRKQ